MYGYFIEKRPKGGYWKHLFRQYCGNHRPDWYICGAVRPFSLLAVAQRQAKHLAANPKNAGYQYRVSLWKRLSVCDEPAPWCKTGGKMQPIIDAAERERDV